MFGKLKVIFEKAKMLDGRTIYFKILQNNRKEVHEIILDINRFDQLFENSESPEGFKLKKYSRTTEIENESKSFTFNEKTRYKTRLDNAFLFDTGKFYGTFRIIDSYHDFTIQADTIKEGKDLREFYDAEIIGINPENYPKILKEILPYLQQAIREWLLQ